MKVRNKHRQTQASKAGFKHKQAEASTDKLQAQDRPAQAKSTGKQRTG
jgi:hypothetical protein